MNLGALCDSCRDLFHVPLAFIALRQGLDLSQVGIENAVPLRRAVSFQQLRCSWLNLIAELWAVDGSGRLVWIGYGQTSIHELVHGLPANCLACIGSVLLAIVVPTEVHDGSDAHHRSAGLGPRYLRLQGEQRKQRHGRPVIQLASWQTKLPEDFESLLGSSKVKSSQE